MTTLYIPLGIAAFGIVLRGSSYAFRKVSIRTAEQHLNGMVFASWSLITPFCFGAVAGGFASGRVPTSDLGGVLAVLTCAYLAAIFLTAEARREGAPDLEQWTRRLAVVAAVAAGVVAISGLFVLRRDAHHCTANC